MYETSNQVAKNFLASSQVQDKIKTKNSKLEIAQQMSIFSDQVPFAYRGFEITESRKCLLRRAHLHERQAPISCFIVHRQLSQQNRTNYSILAKQFFEKQNLSTDENQLQPPCHTTVPQHQLQSRASRTRTGYLQRCKTKERSGRSTSSSRTPPLPPYFLVWHLIRVQGSQRRLLRRSRRMGLWVAWVWCAENGRERRMEVKIEGGRRGTEKTRLRALKRMLRRKQRGGECGVSESPLLLK